MMKSLRTQAGFTLIELLAVMVLMGLVAGAVAPPLDRWYSRFSRRTEADEIVAQVARLPVRAALMGQALKLDAAFFEAPPPPLSDDGAGNRRLALELPAGWRYLDGKLWVNAAGFCQPGTLRFGNQKAQVTIQVSSFQCKVTSDFSVEPGGPG